jgi:Polyketide cyclase / dehydrase and lipid transport
MAHWTTSTHSSAAPERVLEVLTHPESIQSWSPVDFELEDLSASRLRAGTRTRVVGRLAGVGVGFDVEVHSADEEGLALSADGPIGMDVRYALSPASGGSTVTASVSLRGSGGLTGRLVSRATAALLSAGALDGAARSIARAAESSPSLVAA